MLRKRTVIDVASGESTSCRNKQWKNMTAVGFHWTTYGTWNKENTENGGVNFIGYSGSIRLDMHFYIQEDTLWYQ